MTPVAWSDTTVRTVHGNGGYVLPGLVDSHVHLSHLSVDGEEAVRDTLTQFVQRGILRVIDAGGSLEVMSTMSRHVASGELVGPVIAFSGPMAEKPPVFWARLNGEVPGFTVPIETERDVAQLVESVTAAGGTHLKVFAKWDLGLLRSLLVAARQKGLAVILDPGPPFYQDVPVDTALALGIRRIEHAFAPWQVVLTDDLAATHDSLKAIGMTAMDAAGAPFYDSLIARGVESIDRAKLDALVRTWAETDTYFCPTLGVLERERGSQPWNSLADVGRLVVATAARSKVPLLVGQDGLSPARTVEEMIALAAAGVPVAEVIKAATWYPALWSGQSADIGSVAAGKLADLIITESDPLQDLGTLNAPGAVIQGGVVRRENP
jgi:hypothetical protein